ncbi:serine hydrolase, partial [Geodermatophilus sp. SYSU D01062]
MPHGAPPRFRLRGGAACRRDRRALVNSPVEHRARSAVPWRSAPKTVTAVAVMRLRDEGRLGLDDPLDRHVPGTPFGNRSV